MNYDNSPDILKIFGMNLSRYRNLCDKPLTDLATETNITVACLEKVEQGQQNNLTLEAVQLISEAVGVTPPEMLTVAT